MGGARSGSQRSIWAMGPSPTHPMASVVCSEGSPLAVPPLGLGILFTIDRLRADVRDVNNFDGVQCYSSRGAAF